MSERRTGGGDPLRFVATEGPVIGSLCTGVAGLDLGVAAVLGGRIAWYSEVDPHACAVLAARLPGVVNLGDLRVVDFTAVETVEVLTVGFPCQDISAAGRRAGIEKGARSGLWHSILDAIRVLRPQLVVVENVAALRWRNGGLDRVLAGLAEAGYDAVWRCVRAADIGAAHRRERVFLCAVPGPGRDADDAHPASTRRGTARPGRSGAAARGRASGEPQRRGRLGDPAGAVAADADGGGLALGGDPDSAQAGPSDPGRMRDADRLGTAAADPDRLGREELHPRHARRRTVTSRPRTRTQHADATGDGNMLRGNTNSGGGGGARSCLSPGAWGPAADTDRARRFFQRNLRRVPTRRPVSVGHSTTPADPPGDRRHERLPRAARIEGRPDAALGRHRRHHSQTNHPAAEGGE